MRPKIILVFVLAIILSEDVQAHDAVVNGIYYNLDKTTKIAQVTYSSNSSEEYSGDVVIPGNIECGGESYVVKSIGERAFYYCRSLTSITLPSCIESIGRCAFSYTDGLTSMSVDTDNPVYDSRDNCNAIIETANNRLVAGCSATVIPESVTAIGYRAFEGVYNETIFISKNIVSIENMAFDLTSVTSITVDASNPVYDSRDNCNAVIETSTNTLAVGCINTVIPSSVIAIGDYAFGGCQNLENIEFPCTIKSIGTGAFFCCYRLKNAKVPYGVESIKDGTFNKCSNMKTVSLPSSVKSIGFNAFAGCSKLVEFRCGASEPPTTANNTFEGMTLKDVTLYVPESSISVYRNTRNTPWKSFKSIAPLTETIDGITYKFDMATHTAEVVARDSLYKGSIVISEKIAYEEEEYTVTTIGNQAFKGCLELASVSLPVSITKIRNEAFATGNRNMIIHVPSIRNWCNISFDYNPFADYEEGPYTMRYHYGTYFKLYVNGQVITDLVIPDGITTISQYSFSHSEINSIVLPNSITAIEQGAFEGSLVKDISIPESVTNINGGAFADCNQLTTLRLADMDAWYKCILVNNKSNPLYSNPLYYKQSTLFLNGQKVTSLKLPENVTSIGKYQFCGWNMLESIELPETLWRISDGAFSGCSGLKTLHIPDNVTSIGVNAFEGCGFASVNIPNRLTEILSSCFRGCAKLEAVAIPESVRRIDDFAFYNCEALTSISLPETLERISTRAVFKNTGIYNAQPADAPYYIDGWCMGYKGNYTEGSPLLIKDGTKAIVIDEEMNRAATMATSLTIPSSVRKVLHNDYSFKQMRKLETLSIGDGLTSLNGFNFSQSSELSSVVLGNGIETIPDGTFMGLKKLKNVVMGYGLRSIGANAFKDCESLEKVRIPNGVEKIGRNAFSNCQSMTTLTIPNSVTEFGDAAFSDALSLTSVNTLINVPKVLNESVFSCYAQGYDKRTAYYIATLYVPRGRTNIYKNVAAWNLFSNIEEKDIAYELTYVLDGEVYKSFEIQPGITVTPEPDPVKDGYVFGGWHTIPATMPEHDVIVYGQFEPYPTGVEDIPADSVENAVFDDSWYTLDGRRLQARPTRAGIYIHRGKKQIVR